MTTICLDTSVLILGIKGYKNPKLKGMAGKARRYLSYLAKSKETRVMLPAIVVTEYLAGVNPSEHEKQVEYLSKHFFIPAADLKVAARAAAYAFERGKRRKKNASSRKKKPTGKVQKSRNEVRCDELIVATAIMHDADKIVTGDINHFTTIAQGRIIIEDIPHIAEQLNLLS